MSPRFLSAVMVRYKSSQVQWWSRRLPSWKGCRRPCVWSIFFGLAGAVRQNWKVLAYHCSKLCHGHDVQEQYSERCSSPNMEKGGQKYFSPNLYIIFKIRLEHQKLWKCSYMCILAIWCYLQFKYFLIAFFYHKWLNFIYRCNQKFHVFNPLWPWFLHHFPMNLFTTFQGPYGSVITVLYERANSWIYVGLSIHVFVNVSHVCECLVVEMNSVCNISGKSLDHKSRISVKELGAPRPNLKIVQEQKQCKSRWGYTCTFNKALYNAAEWLCGCEAGP